MRKHDPVNHPKHYDRADTHPSGVECIEMVEQMPFCIGNALKYMYRAEHKEKLAEDYRKAAWYLKRSVEGSTPKWKLTSELTRERLANWRDGETKPRKRVLAMILDAILYGTETAHYVARVTEAAKLLNTMADEAESA